MNMYLAYNLQIELVFECYTYKAHFYSIIYNNDDQTKKKV